MDFYERAKMICENIPRGRVATYGQIALLCGRPRNARQVGYALNKGRLGDVPAYRVVSGNGVLSGAAAFETYDMQKILLEAEGVETGPQPVWLENDAGGSRKLPGDVSKEKYLIYILHSFNGNPVACAAGFLYTCICNKMPEVQSKKRLMACMASFIRD